MATENILLIEIIQGDHAGVVFELEEGTNLIGRWDPEKSSFPEIDLDDYDDEGEVSRKHAVLRKKGSSITIEDIGSLNGTFINLADKITPNKEISLAIGDEIVVGKLILRVRYQ